MSPDAFVAYGAGADMSAGTSDDLLIVVKGLLSSSFQIATIPIPFAAPTSFALTRTGIGVVADATATAALPLLIVRDLGTSPLLTPFPVTFSPMGIPLFGRVTGGLEDSVVAGLQDDLGPGMNGTFVRNLSSFPSLSPFWYDDYNGGCYHLPIRDGETLLDCGAGSGNPFVFTSYTGPFPVQMTLPGYGGDPASYLRPSERGLLRFANGNGAAYAAVFNDVPGAGTPTVFVNPSAAFIQAVVMGPGLVAWFTGPPSSPPTLLRILTIGTFESIGPTLGPGSVPSPLTLAASPATPVAGGSFQLFAWHPYLGPLNSYAIAFAYGSAPATPAVSVPYPQSTHLDLSLLAAILPLPTTGGVGTLSVDLSAALPFAGLDVYLQALIPSPPSGFVLSDTFRLVIGLPELPRALGKAGWIDCAATPSAWSSGCQSCLCAPRGHPQGTAPTPSAWSSGCQSDPRDQRFGVLSRKNARRMPRDRRAMRGATTRHVGGGLWRGGATKRKPRRGSGRPARARAETRQHAAIDAARQRMRQGFSGTGH